MTAVYPIFMTTANATQTVTEEIRSGGPRALTVEHRFASRNDGVAADLTISKEDASRSERFCKLTGRMVVRWTWRRSTATGWGPTCKVTFANETEARAFADVKWARVKAWIARQPAAHEQNGAAAAFSSQVASMRTF